jgi:hypothetical protein
MKNDFENKNFVIFEEVDDDLGRSDDDNFVSRFTDL